MKDIAIADVRTFVLLGHNGSGKTTLVDAILYRTGVNDRMGLVSAKSSMADFTEEEKERGFTLYTKPFNVLYTAGGERKIQMAFVDTPGVPDFYGQVILGTSVVESALIVVDATSGLQVGSSRGWKRCETLGIPRGVVVTGLDKENADFTKVLEEIRGAWGDKCIPLTVPGRNGVVEVLAGEPPVESKETIEGYKLSLMEAVAESDDQLLEKYLGGEELTTEELARGARGAFLRGKLVPVFACSPLKEAGIGELLEWIARIFPSPLDCPMKDGNGQPIDPKGPFCGYIWRTVNDPFIGQLTFMRVVAGQATADQELWNATKGERERISGFLEVNGKKQTVWTECRAGDLIAMAKLKKTGLGDVLLSAPGDAPVFPKLEFPMPVYSLAVRGRAPQDEDKIGTALQRLAEEDPTIQVRRDEDTHETILSGLGDMHLAVAVDRMKRRQNVEALTSVPKVPYKETVTGTGEGHYKHKKQTGGRGQYAEVYLRVSRLPSGETEWFEDAVVGGVIPGNFMPAVQKGLVEGMKQGTVAGYPVVNVKITVYDGSYHEVDSSEIAFKIAAARAFKDGMSKAKPVLLEPIMQVRIFVPDQFLGDVTGDINHRRGRIMGMGSEGGMQIITAEVPMAELFMYAAELRSMTGGRGSFEMVFSRYEIVPSNVAQKVIAEAAKTKQEEEE